MKVYRLAFVAGSVLFLALPAHASQDLVTKNSCVACHQMDKKVVGPAWKEIASKYKGDPKAAEKLTTKVKAGGAGVWGPIPMPPQSAPEAEIKSMVQWILTL